MCIYNSRQDFLNNISFSPFPDRSKQESENFFIAGQFSYPYIYVCDYNLDFICKCLRRDECMEQLTIFLSQSEPLKKPEFETIDLQDYVEGRLSAQEIQLRSYARPGNKLLRFIPPKVPQSHLSIAPICLPEDQICNICRDQDYEIWNLIKLHHMGLL